MMNKPESKITRMAEVLPKNNTTQKILKEREEIAAAKAEREKAVSTHSLSVLNLHPYAKTAIFKKFKSLTFSLPSSCKVETSSRQRRA